MMTRILENLVDDEKENLSQWIKDIETAADEKVRKLSPKQMNKRNPETVTAAAVYDAFLQFESRTNVKVGFKQMQIALGRSACSINTAWKRLFDNRVYLRGEFLDLVYTDRHGTVSDAISKVIQALKNAAETDTQEVALWLAEIETEAVELFKTLSPSTTKRYDALLIAITTIYTAVQRYHGKILIPIGQKDLSLLAATSPAMISKCWIEFFNT
jgi:hypothetical protein